MKRASILTALFLACAGLVLAQTDAQPDQELDPDAPWRLLVYPAGAAEAEQDVTDFVREGFIPVGFEVEPDESLSILLTQSGEIEIEGWAIIDYTDWNELEGEITGSIQEGFVPMDISRYGDAIAVLWVEADLPVEGWRIHAAENTISGRTRALNEFQEQGFALWGFSVHEDLAWYLFLSQPGSQPAGAVSSYSKATDAIQQGVLGATQSGWLPYGLGISPDNFYVSFIK